MFLATDNTKSKKYEHLNVEQIKNKTFKENH